jgi:putative selenate reductase
LARGGISTYIFQELSGAKKIMTELNPLPFDYLLYSIFQEYEQKRTIFSLEEKYFYRPQDGDDFSCEFRGQKASTPVGPAAGPQTQMAQNILCAWLAGARIMELKTVQVMDSLEIPRPCIDVSNVCFNVEWSQELTIEKSLMEYVKAWYLIHILRAASIEGISPTGADTLFDLSVGYDLKGVQSDKVVGFIRGMKDATATMDKLRQQIPAQFSKFRDLPVDPHIASGVTISTFHGCPPQEIEKIALFLLKDMGLHTVIKLNPTLLGQERVLEILHQNLGYRDLEIPSQAFEKDLPWNSAVDMIGRLQSVAREEGRHFGIKLSNTLVVRNDRRRFSEPEMYMSGRPLHVIALNLVAKFRSIFGEALPISFSAGIDAENFAQTVACNLVPITACTDLLRTGGYSRIARYLAELGKAMKGKNAAHRDEYILNFSEHGKKVLSGLLAEEAWTMRIKEEPVLQNFTSALQERLAQKDAATAWKEARQTLPADTLSQSTETLKKL